MLPAMASSNPNTNTTVPLRWTTALAAKLEAEATVPKNTDNGNTGGYTPLTPELREEIIENAMKLTDSQLAEAEAMDKFLREK